MQAESSALRREDVYAVVVTYRPELPLLEEAIDAVLPQVGRLLVFDNATADPQYTTWLGQAEAHGRIEVLRSPANVGLGAAINQAWQRARAGGFRHLLLLDQDSVADPAMVATLHDALARLRCERPVAAVGPAFHDARDGRAAPFVRIGFPLNRKLHGAPGQCIECDFLITSGSLLPLDVLERIGGMDAGLFIDNVDLEWSFRARSRGHALYGVCDAGMRHRIGDRLRRVPGLRNPVQIHGPVRLYYMMRNRVLLYRRAHVPRTWVAQDVPRLLLKLAGMGLFVRPRLANLRAMLRGIAHGIAGRDGPMPG